MPFFTSETNTAFSFKKRKKSNTVFLLILGFLVCSSAKAQPCLFPIINNAIQIGPATCAGTVATLQGSILAGGIGTYTYQWQKSLSSCTNFQPIAGATEKDYAVPSSAGLNDCFRRVVTSGTCTSNSNNITVPLSERTSPPLPVTVAINSTCITPSGSITVTNPLPGTGISYSIDGANYTNTTGIFSSLTPGTYSVTAKFPADCISPVRTVVISATPAINGNINPASASFCAGGSRVLQVNGGNSYQWYRNDTLITGATGSTYPATVSGTYTADIIVGICREKASNSCVVTVIPLPTGSISPASGVLCPNLPITLQTSGGTSYQWSRNGQAINGATLPSITINQAGTYTVTIMANGCTGSATNSVLITQGVAPSGFITPASAVLCPGSQVPLTVTTASGVNTYQWFKDGFLISNATAATYNAMQTGNYSVVISNGTCNSQATNIVGITSSNAISFNTAFTNLSCTSTTGSITVSGVTGGGSTNYRYSKDNGTTYQTAATFANLTAGSYQVVVRDTAGCISSPRSVVIPPFNSSITGTANTTNTRCGLPNGSAIINATGGTGPYTYKLDNDNYQASNSFSNLTLGSHKVTVRDAPGCVFDVVFIINQGITNPNLIITNPPVICPGFAANLRAVAVTAGSDSGLLFTYFRDSATLTALPNPGAATAGTYYIKATNSAGCITVKSVLVTLQLTCLPESRVYVPTGFTPNRNSANDVLRPILYNIIELRYFKVYNRWGQEVFKTSTLNKGWDGTIKGTPQPAETYSWILECVGKNGDVIKQSGRSLLIR